MLAVLVARLVHHETNHIFAPIAAVVALSGPRGERGRHAIRLVVGVFIGIGIAEIAIVLLPAHVLTLGLAAFTAMLVARHLSDERVLIVQAGASAILTMALANGAAGIDRLVDACIGAGIALAFSQLAALSTLGSDLLELLTSIFNPLPGMAILPLAMLWFGLGETSIVFTIALATIWPSRTL